ncbi:MAG: AAA+ superfamily predicted ATPase, partial [Chlamydiales bacterium]
FCLADDIPCKPFSRVTFSVKPFRSQYGQGKGLTSIDVNVLRAKVQELFSKQPLETNQSMYLELPGSKPIVLTVDSEHSSSMGPRAAKRRRVRNSTGVITSQTQLDFKVNLDHPGIQLVEHINIASTQLLVELSFITDKFQKKFSLGREHVSSAIENDSDSEDEGMDLGGLMMMLGGQGAVRLSGGGVSKPSKSDWREGLPPLPFQVAHDELEDLLISKFSEQDLSLGSDTVVEIGRYGFIRATVRDAGYLEAENEVSLKEKQRFSPYKLCFTPSADCIKGIRVDKQLCDDDIVVGNQYLALSDDDSIEFTIEDRQYQKNHEKSPQMRIDVGEFSQAVKELSKGNKWFIQNGCFPLELSTGKFLFRVAKVRTGEISQADIPSAFVRPGTNTTLSLNVMKSDGLTLCNGSETHELESVKVKVKYVPEDTGMPAFMMPQEEERETISLSEEQVEAFFQGMDKSRLFMEQTLVQRFDDSGSLHLVVSEMKFKDGTPAAKHSLLGAMSLETNVQFVSEDREKLRIFTIPKDVELKGIVARLRDEMGVGGVSDQFQEIVRRILLSRSSNPVFKQFGIKAPKGILLYGPPGTGKTLLAKQLGKILSCTEDRVTMIDGTSIYSKWVGESSKNVRNLFKPAREEWAQYKRGEISEAPMHLIIVDEVDSFLKKRDESGDPHAAKPTNAFLGQIDGLNEMENVLFIGISNRRSSLDPAVLRPGRLEVQLEISLPDDIGREEIFQIHTKQLRKDNLLDSKVDFKVLVEKTKGFSGADIASTVKEAVSYVQRRMLEKLSDENPETAIITDKDRQVTMKDLLKSLKHLEPEKNDPPFGMYL